MRPRSARRSSKGRIIVLSGSILIPYSFWPPSAAGLARIAAIEHDDTDAPSIRKVTESAPDYPKVLVMGAINIKLEHATIFSGAGDYEGPGSASHCGRKCSSTGLRNQDDVTISIHYSLWPGEVWTL
jgi:hypothetical protein